MGGVDGGVADRVRVEGNAARLAVVSVLGEVIPGRLHVAEVIDGDGGPSQAVVEDGSSSLNGPEGDDSDDMSEVRGAERRVRIVYSANREETELTRHTRNPLT